MVSSLFPPVNHILMQGRLRGPFTYFGNESYSFIRFLPEKFQKVLKTTNYIGNKSEPIPGSEEPMVTPVHVGMVTNSGTIQGDTMTIV
jgi:hypothetical protein